MSDEQHIPDERDKTRWYSRLIPSRAIVALVLGVLLGAICPLLPAPVRAPCQLVSRVIPSACGTTSDSKGKEPK